MSMLIILLLLILAIVFAVFKHIKKCLIILILTLVCFYMIGNGIIPSLLLTNLELPYQEAVEPKFGQNRNAIVVLGAGSAKVPGTNIVKPSLMAYSRIFEGLRLYYVCKSHGHQCTLILSGGDAQSVGTSEALVYKKELLKFNIQESDIQIEPQSLNTYKNAEFTSAYLKTHNFENVFLVSSGIHMKRALLYFLHFGIKMVPMPSDYIVAYPSFFPLSYNFTIMDFTLHEYIGILRYHIYNWFGWNAKASVAGYP